MQYIDCNINPISRVVSYPGATIVQRDTNVEALRFHFSLDAEYELENDSIRIMVLKDGKTNGFNAENVRVETNDGGDEELVFEHTITTHETATPGQIAISVCGNQVSGNNITEAWHTLNMVFQVSSAAHSESDEGEDTPETIASNAEKIAALQTLVNAITSGRPIPVDLKSKMTDTSAIYLYTGTETGEQHNYWYYHDGTSWVPGSEYGGMTIDDELSSTSENAVQNKVIKANFDEINGRLDPIVDALGVEQKTEKLPYDTVENGFYRNGAFTANTGYKSYSYTVTPQTEYLVTAYCVFGATGVGICQYFDSSDNLLSIENVESGATYTDYPITTPNNCTKLIVINKYDGSHTYDGGYGAVKSTVTVSNRLDNIESKIGFFAVDVNNDVISIVQPYSDTHDLRITMQKCGSSSLMQLFGFYFDAIVAGAESFSKVSSTDWLGPYKVLADSNPTQNIGSSWFYTGGWHGADNTVNGYPTGKTIEYKVFCDGEPVPSDGTKVKGNSVRVYVKNHICGNNTTDTTGGDDFRYILQEEITYDFSEDGKCYVQNLITALEDIHIREYYGLQIASNGGKWMSRQSIYGTDLVDVSLNNQNLSQAFLFNPQFLVAVDDNSNFVIAHTEHIGLGEETYNHYATGQGAHISNGKMYWDLIYAFPYLALASGQRAYVKGWYRWADSENIC